MQCKQEYKDQVDTVMLYSIYPIPTKHPCCKKLQPRI